MPYKTIANMPTVLKPEDVTDSHCKGWHESLLRAFHILQKVKWLLEKGTDNEVVLELIRVMESNDFQPYGWHQEQYREQSVPGIVKEHSHEPTHYDK